MDGGGVDAGYSYFDENEEECARRRGGNTFFGGGDIGHYLGDE